MHVHLIGVAGTGMGSLAGLLVQAGHRVSGSDTAFYPPMGDALERFGVETMPGWDPANLDASPDLVVIGNVCRADNPEAVAAFDRGLRTTSFPQVMEEFFLTDRPSYVVAGTHGKTTTTTMLAFLLMRCGRDPGFLVGGIPKDFAESFRIGGADAPFVIEGDEYDTAFFEKKPKFWRYRANAAILTTLEHDHIDIYPNMAAYRAAFEGFVTRLEPGATLVAWAGDPEVRGLAASAPCRVVYYGLDGDDTGDVVPEWSAALAPPMGGTQPFDLFLGGTAAGRVLSPLFGRHNVRNAVAAFALAAETSNASTAAMAAALRDFRGTKRRQEWLGEPGGVRVYDDFAHHPSAVRETLAALRDKHPEGRLIALYEPRSATAARSLHQREYPDAFRHADLVLLAPVGRSEIPTDERLDTGALANALRQRDQEAVACASTDGLVTQVRSTAEPGDTVVIMSNGAFDGVWDKVLLALTERHLERGQGEG